MDPFRQRWAWWLKWPTIGIVGIIVLLPDPMWWTAPPVLYKAVFAALILLIANLISRRCESWRRRSEGEKKDAG
tara:strand:- start:232 stop:453 length:222 start_codon:yes stop_codon:yes gene_type:complete